MTKITWPNNAQCALALTFDFDAESLWLANNPRHQDLPAVLSLGKYGAKVGVPKILDLLREENIRATFFVPGWVAENYSSHVEAILANGHEVAHHGYTHVAPDPSDPELVESELMRGIDALVAVTGLRPRGYRAPDGVSCEQSLRLLTEQGLLYNSSFKDDFVPYRHQLADGSPGPIEIPEQPTLDDWAYGSSSLTSPRPLFTKEHVLSIWSDEFRELYAWGGAVTLVMHPQITGRPMRLATLREFIAFTRELDHVWYATCEDIATAFIQHEKGCESSGQVGIHE